MVDPRYVAKSNPKLDTPEETTNTEVVKDNTVATPDIQTTESVVTPQQEATVTDTVTPEGETQQLENLPVEQVNSQLPIEEGQIQANQEQLADPSLQTLQTLQDLQDAGLLQLSLLLMYWVPIKHFHHLYSQ